MLARRVQLTPDGCSPRASLVPQASSQWRNRNNIKSANDLQAEAQLGSYPENGPEIHGFPPRGAEIRE
jgi:hypothetical protein